MAGFIRKWMVRFQAMSRPRNKSKKKRSPIAIAAWVVGLGCGGVLALAFIAFLIFGILIQRQVAPDTMAIRGSDLRPNRVQAFRDEGWLNPTENVLWFYSDATLSFRQDGNAVTDERILHWYEDWNTGTWHKDAARWENIVELDSDYRTGFFDSSSLWVVTDSGKIFEVLVSNEDGLDRDFIDAAQNQWKKHQTKQD